MLLSTFFFALMNLCVKLVSHIPAVEVIFFRSAISLVMSYAVLRSKGVKALSSNYGLLFARGASGVIALMLFFTTLQKIPLATAATLQYLAPIFTTILGIFIVKEQVKPWQWLFFAVSFGGILVIQGVDISADPFYIWLGVLSAVFSGVAYGLVRRLNAREHPLVIVLSFPLVGFPVTLVLSLFNWVQPQGWDWAMLLLVGVLTQLGQYYMTMSYQAEEISKVANLNYLGIIYALSFGFIFFGETFTLWSYLGMALVLVGVVLNVAYKNRLAKQQVNQIQKRASI
ncbi:EamA family transporter [Pontibacter sp. SGAir0037]|nr:EamA family transporter [Pontibacter sp. SGAir0037]